MALSVPAGQCKLGAICRRFLGRTLVLIPTEPELLRDASYSQKPLEVRRRIP